MKENSGLRLLLHVSAYYYIASGLIHQQLQAYLVSFSFFTCISAANLSFSASLFIPGALSRYTAIYPFQVHICISYISSIYIPYILPASALQILLSPHLHLFQVHIYIYYISLIFFRFYLHQRCQSCFLRISVYSRRTAGPRSLLCKLVYEQIKQIKDKVLYINEQVDASLQKYLQREWE